MAKHHAKKPPKKREQPWMEAARERLRGPSIFMAFTGFAFQIVPPRAPPAIVQRAFDAARFAWNLPLLHALPTEPDTDGADIRAEAEAWLANLPEYLPLLAPLFAQRTTELASFREPVVEASARKAPDGSLDLHIAVGPHIGHAPLLEIGPSGWPDAADSLIHLSTEAQALVPEHLSGTAALVAANEVAELATLAWNELLLDRPRSALNAQFRRFLEEGARRARELPEPGPTVFERMCRARRAQFGYDRRILFGDVRVRGSVRVLHVAEIAEEAFDDPRASLTEEELSRDWFPALRTLLQVRSSEDIQARRAG